MEALFNKQRLFYFPNKKLGDFDVLLECASSKFKKGDLVTGLLKIKRACGNRPFLSKIKLRKTSPLS
jgi:hypothetical protein